MATKTYEIIDGVEKLTEAIARVRKAQQVFATYTQEQVDKIFLAAASAANKAPAPISATAFINLLSSARRAFSSAMRFASSSFLVGRPRFFVSAMLMLFLPAAQRAAQCPYR